MIMINHVSSKKNTLNFKQRNNIYNNPPKIIKGFDLE